jgi:hypothetical protein
VSPHVNHIRLYTDTCVSLRIIKEDILPFVQLEMDSARQQKEGEAETSGEKL